MLLKSSGIRDYSIFIDETTNALFSVMNAHSHEAVGNLPAHPVMKKGWAYMKDNMKSNSNNSPVTVPLLI
jgi:L-rhamnose mutarotase